MLYCLIWVTFLTIDSGVFASPLKPSFPPPPLDVLRNSTNAARLGHPSRKLIHVRAGLPRGVMSGNNVAPIPADNSNSESSTPVISLTTVSSTLASSKATLTTTLTPTPSSVRPVVIRRQSAPASKLLPTTISYVLTSSTEKTAISSLLTASSALTSSATTGELDSTKLSSYSPRKLLVTELLPVNFSTVTDENSKSLVTLPTNVVTSSDDVKVSNITETKISPNGSISSTLASRFAVVSSKIPNNATYRTIFSVATTTSKMPVVSHTPPTFIPGPTTVTIFSTEDQRTSTDTSDVFTLSSTDTNTTSNASDAVTVTIAADSDTYSIKPRLVSPEVAAEAESEQVITFQSTTSSLPQKTASSVGTFEITVTTSKLSPSDSTTVPLLPTTVVISTTLASTPTTLMPIDLCGSTDHLVCISPDFDKNELRARCSWQAIVADEAHSLETLSYFITVKELSDSRPKNLATNVSTIDFPVKPGKIYEISVFWMFLNANNSDNSECKYSSYLLPVPYERPRLQVDPEWISVNLSLSMVFIKNPFYQSMANIVNRLAVDLSLPQNNSSIFCSPSFWYNVPLSEKMSCQIMNLNNDTIEELIVTLNASGDPSGKDPNSVVSTKEKIVFVSATKATAVFSGGVTLPSPSSSPVVNNVAAAGGGAAAGVILGAILVVVIIWVVRRYRSNTPKQTWQSNIAMPAGLALADDVFASSNNLSSTEFASGPISSDKFRAYVQSLERNSGLGYASLWEDVRLVGLNQSTLAAEFPVNRVKNRFTNVLPYDESRVKLLPWPSVISKPVTEERQVSADSSDTANEFNDYVNANFVPGLYSDHEYIATQGPLPVTIADFWRMVWQQRVCAIVMLTKLKEGGARKCECYWPPGVDSDVVEPFGPLNVQLVSQSDEIASPVPTEEIGVDNAKENGGVWTTRDFRISLQSDDQSNSSQTRTLRQYQFNAWPDQGVPSGRNCYHLLRFVRLVRNQIGRSSGSVVEPILVHCSAGVGRSGAFIAMDILMQDMAAGRPLDVTGVVRKLREHRQLVQTEQQFRFIHELLLDATDESLALNFSQRRNSSHESSHIDGTAGQKQLNGNGFEVVSSRRRNKGKANTAFVEDDENAQTSELDDRL